MQDTNCVIEFWVNFKLEPTGKCSFCEDEPETLIYLCLQCPITKQFWQNVLNWINTHPGHENVELSMNMLLGLANCKTVILNSLILIARYYIFLSKTRKEKPTYSLQRKTELFLFYREIDIPSTRKTGGFSIKVETILFVYYSSPECFLCFPFIS